MQTGTTHRATCCWPLRDPGSLDEVDGPVAGLAGIDPRPFDHDRVADVLLVAASGEANMKSGIAARRQGKRMANSPTGRGMISGATIMSSGC